MSTYNAVVYNYLNKTWSVRTYSKPVRSFGVYPERALAVSELSGSVASQTTTVEGLDASGEAAQLVVGSDGKVYKLTFSGSLETQDLPVLETGDMLYGSLETMKEVSRIHISAEGTFSGIKVEVSARNALSDSVSYTNVGTWTTTLPENALTFAAKAGRVLRYRFTPQGEVKNFKFHGYEDNVVQAGARR